MKRSRNDGATQPSLPIKSGLTMSKTRRACHQSDTLLITSYTCPHLMYNMPSPSVGGAQSSVTMYRSVLLGVGEASFPT